MSGLLKRSTAYRKRLLVQGDVDPRDLLQQETSGISPRDRSEILSEIDRITSQHAAGLSSDALQITRAARRGFLFPLVVNLAMLLLAAGGLFGLYTFFERQEQELVREEPAAVAAQGELVRRIQEQAQAEVDQKEREIADIQERLSDIEARRAALAEDMEDRIAEREAALRAELETELSEARERLAAEGASDAAIAERLGEIRASERADIQSEIAQMRAEADAEQAALEENLAELETEYQQQLAELQNERQEILEEARQREAELRSGFEDRIAQSEEQLSAAQAELEALTRRRERERLAATQLIGFYTEIRDEIRGESWGAALATIEQTREYLAEESVAELPAIERRQEAEFFVLSSLESLVESRRQAREGGTESLIAQAEALREATRLVNEGNAAFDEGNVSLAEERYREALDVIPPISATHDYFMTQQGEIADQLRSAEEERAEAAQAAVGDARAAFGAGNYETALAAYEDALALLPQDAASADDIVSDIRQSGTILSDRAVVAAQTEAARAPYQSALAALGAGDYDGALSGFITVIDDYPRSRQMQELPAALEEAVATRVALLRENLGAVEARLEATQDEAQAEIEALAEENEQLRGRIADLDEELARTVSRLEASRQETQEAREAAARAQGEAEEAAEEATRATARAENREAPALDEELQQELAQLRDIEERYRALVEEYEQYAEREDTVLASGTGAARVRTKLMLDSFLTSQPVRRTMPGIRERIKAYDRAFEEAGRETAILDTVDIVYELSTYEASEERLSYLRRERSRTDDPNMVAFLDELEVLITSGE